MDWLGAALGQYRASEAARETTPSRDDEIRFARQAADTLRQASALFELAGLPPHIGAATHETALAQGDDWPGLRLRLRADLSRALALIETGADRLARQAAKRGRPDAQARDAVLRGLCDRLRATPMPPAPARELAESILIRCRVPVPSTAGDHRAMQRAVKDKRQK